MFACNFLCLPGGAKRVTISNVSASVWMHKQTHWWHAIIKEKRRTQKHCNTVAHNTFKNKRQRFELFSFYLQGTVILSISLPRTTSAPLDIHCHPANRCRIPAPKKLGDCFLGGRRTWDQNNCPWLWGCWPQNMIMISIRPWKNPANSPFLLKILFFVHQQNMPPQVTTTSLVKGEKNTAPPSEILRRHHCRLLEDGLHSALPVTLLAGYVNDQWDVHQKYLEVNFNLKRYMHIGNSRPGGRFWHKLPMQKQNLLQVKGTKKKTIHLPT